MAYTPSKAPNIEKVEDLRRYVEQELLAISRAQVDFDNLKLNPLYAPPPKPRPGLLVFADGTTWNPGGGQGVYVMNLAGTWVKL